MGPKWRKIGEILTFSKYLPISDNLNNNYHHFYYKVKQYYNIIQLKSQKKHYIVNLKGYEGPWVGSKWRKMSKIWGLWKLLRIGWTLNMKCYHFYYENKEYYNNIELKWQEKYYLVHLKGYMGPSIGSKCSENGGKWVKFEIFGIYCALVEL